MELIDDRLKELTDWLEEVKGIKLDEDDINYFKRLLRRTTNDGKRKLLRQLLKLSRT